MSRIFFFFHPLLHSCPSSSPSSSPPETEFKALSRSCKNNFSCEAGSYHYEFKGKRCTACRTLACVKIVPHLVNDMLLKGEVPGNTKWDVWGWVVWIA